MNEQLELIRAPHITEKTTRLKEEGQVLCFKVAPHATKIDVRRTVERVFSVKVDSVRMLNVGGKRKRTRNMQGYGFRPDQRKAYVKLKPGQKPIEYFEGV